MGTGGPRQGAGPPDGGWGWVVLGACFVVTGFAYGFPKAVSVFFQELKRDFGAGYSDTAWVSSIMLAMLYGTGQHCPQTLPPGLLLGLGIWSLERHCLLSPPPTRLDCGSPQP